MCPAGGVPAGSREGTATTIACPPVPSCRSRALVLSRTRSPISGEPTTATRDYERPDVALTADEAAAGGLAARRWTQAGLADAASSALIKLRAAGIDADPAALGELEPRVEANEAAFEPLLEALRAGRAVTFDYQPHP